MIQKKDMKINTVMLALLIKKKSHKILKKLKTNLSILLSATLRTHIVKLILKIQIFTNPIR